MYHLVYQVTYHLVYQVTYHLVCQVTYQNTTRNVDVPELGSSRYIETRSPADRHHQSHQVHPVHLLHYIVHRVVLPTSAYQINILHIIWEDAAPLKLKLQEEKPIISIDRVLKDADKEERDEILKRSQIITDTNNLIHLTNKALSNKYKKELKQYSKEDGKGLY